ncbi:MAG: DUF5702 domain-containing protein [Lachnospiraceae bacterium]|nr:DUF5702 domain-containing protein [Lachnospiraceae bacterium]
MIHRPYKEGRIIKGEITVFLALLSSLFLALFAAMARSARLQLIRMNIEGVMDASLRSCFGEYSQYLFKRYDLLYIDSSYRGTMPSGIDSLINHLSAYMSENMDYCHTPAQAEWYRETVTDAAPVSYVSAADEGGRPYKSQAVEYIEKYGQVKYLGTINGSKDAFLSIKKVDFYSEWDEILARIDAYGLPLTNPGKIVRGMVLGEEEFLKNASVKGSIGASSGNGGGAGTSKLKRKNESDELFIEYLMQKLGCLTEYREDQVITGELEYIVYGQAGDHDNLVSTVKDLMDKRLSDNLRAIRSDGGKMAAAYEKAYQVVMFNTLEIPDPALVRLVRDSIVYAWAYGESAMDVTRLVNKGRCQVVKASSEIDLGLNDLLNFRSRLFGSGGSGLSYKELMGIYVSAVSDDLRRKRSMDIIEGNLRAFYNPSFRIDGCYEYLRGRVSLSSAYGHDHTIEREYLYE